SNYCFEVNLLCTLIIEVFLLINNYCIWKLIISLSRYLWAVRPSPQNLAEAKKLGGGSTVRKSPIGEG
ncbi:hypothetical protein OE319_22785, partial [Bacillus cereus]|nr:hypothetical protein [Bacillus cereus]